MPRTIIVGDVHGCADELDDLLAALDVSVGHDRVVFVGDLVARGPDSAGVIERVMALGAEGVRGNHDEAVLRWWRVACVEGRKAADRAVRLSLKHRAVVDALEPRHFARLAAFPLCLPLPEHGVVVLHAGVDPSRGLSHSAPDTLITARSVDATGAVTCRLQGEPWATRWRGPEHLVFGHDARRGLQLAPFATGLDTGCVYGRYLSALVLERGRSIPGDPVERAGCIVRVPARRAYVAPGVGEGAGC